MKKQARFFLIIASILFVPAAFGRMIGSGSRIDIPVIVNYLGDTSPEGVDKAIAKANEILKQASIKLVVAKENPQFSVGDGNDVITSDEAGEVKSKGQEELKNTLTDENGKWCGKGVKLNIANNVLEEKPNTLGWATHRIPSFTVEKTSDPNQMGQTIVHELLHVLTIENHSTDPGDVMYPTYEGGTNITKAEIEEILLDAMKRGDVYFFPMITVPEDPVSIDDIKKMLEAIGAELDKEADPNVEPAGIVDPNDPNVAFGDMREVTLYCPDPFGDAAEAVLEIHVNGLFGPAMMVDSFFDVFFDPNEIGEPNDPLFGIHIGLGVAEWINLKDPGAPPVPLQMYTYDNQFFDIDPMELVSSSIKVIIPMEMFGFELGGRERMKMWVESRLGADIPPLGVVYISDETGAFDFKVRRDDTGPAIEIFCDMEAGGGWTLLGSAKSGFTGGHVVTMEVDGEPVADAPAEADGSVEVVVSGFALTEGEHEIRLVEEGSGAAADVYSSAIFTYCADGAKEADLNVDCKVDLVDLAIMANEWLAGT